jgi:ferredoxin
MSKVTVWPKGLKLEIDNETRLMTALKQAGIYIKSSCGGKASCTDCIVKITNGAENLETAQIKEKQLLGNVFHITKERLSCQTFVNGDIEVDVSEHNKENDEKSREKKTRLRKKDEIEEKPQEVLEKRKSIEGGKKRPKTFKTKGD